MAASESRPEINTLKSAQELRRWYWLKTELVAYCKQQGLSPVGNKFAIIDRISEYLETGKVVKPLPSKIKHSTVNWAKSVLTLDTVITDSVTFGKNFRGFMQSQIGHKFVCHSDFMDWVKANAGKTLADAVRAWYRLEDRKRDPSFKRTIAPQNMLAQYTRDFFAANPDKTRADMMDCWQLKKKQPNAGRVIYETSDLLFLDQKQKLAE